MPLDIKPLSLTRRVLMILLMLALLGGSLGFAQWLISRQPGPIEVQFLPPAGLQIMPVNITDPAEGMPPEPLLRAVIHPAQGTRNLYAFHFQSDRDTRPDVYIQVILDRILPDPADRSLGYNAQQIDGIPAYEVERQVGRRADSTFALLRFAPVSDHIVAFCLSGDGQITDADRQFFDSYCTHQIRIKIEKPPRKG